LSEPISLGAVQVIDGDIIRVGRIVYRLVGFDTPEVGSRAGCERERTLAAHATRRLRELIAGGGLDLLRVRCACPLDTEGTPRCNHGRLCGVFTARGRDVGEILMLEGLAYPFVCGPTSCPPQQGWCG
jgi:endonuclease YncB( thermonuclease family)